MKKRYSVDGKIYEIPDHESEAFLTDNPHAVEVKHYDVEVKAYEIPLDKTTDFEKDFDIQQPVVGQPDTESKSAKLYNNLLKEGYTVKNLGSQDEFTQAVSDPVKADKIYSGLINDGYSDKNLGSKDDFMSTFVQKKSDVPISPVSSNTPDPFSVNSYAPNQLDNTQQTQPTSEFDNQNPIDLAKQSGELSKKTISLSSGNAGEGSGKPLITADPEAIAKSKNIDKYITDKGFDPNVIKSAASMPDDYYNALGITKDQMAQQIQSNPTKAQQQISGAKWQIPVENEILKQHGQQGLIDFQNMRNVFDSNSTDYATKRKLAPQLLIATRQYSDKGTMNELQSNFATDAAIGYGNVQDTDPTLQKEQLQFPNLNLNQIRALDYLHDVVPEQAQSYAPALIDPKLIKDNPDAQTGQQEKLQRLEEIGLKLKENSIKATDLSGGKDPNVQSQLNDIQDQRNSLLINYPKAGVNDAELFAQELLGQKHTGLNWLALKSGEATSGAVNSIWDLVSEPFRSQQNSNIHQLSTLGWKNHANCPPSPRVN